MVCVALAGTAGPALAQTPLEAALAEHSLDGEPLPGLHAVIAGEPVFLLAACAEAEEGGHLDEGDAVMFMTSPYQEGMLYYAFDTREKLDAFVLDSGIPQPACWAGGSAMDIAAMLAPMQPPAYVVLNIVTGPVLLRPADLEAILAAE